MLKIEYIDSTLLKKAFIVAANNLEKNKHIVDALNVFPVPDGDTGTNMSLTMKSAIKQIKNLEEESIQKIATAISNGSLMGARGNSGVILSQLFRGFAKGLKGKEKLDTRDIANAFKSGSDTAYRAVMRPTEGTILTVARECAEKALEISSNENDIKIFMEKVIEHGEITLDKTPEMLDVLKQAGVVDAGGKGLIFILKGALKAIISDELDFEEIEEVEEEVHFERETGEQEIKYGYCTEFIINNTKADAEEFKKKINDLGDSVLAVSGDNIIKVHIHTNNPGLVIERALKLGELINIKIDNMRFQHRRNVEKEDSDIKLENNDIEETKKYSFITVAMGDGLNSVFKDFNVDYVIAGGQTMNPSTEDILNAVNKVNGENIIILPNNSNIILAANQAKKLSDKNIEVVPTKTIPQGIAALLAFDEEIDVEKNLDNMKEAIESVKTGQVTFAVRDTVINDIEIKKDDIIGINDGEIVSVGNDINKVSSELVNNLIDEEDSLITIFYGEDVREEKARELVEILEEENEDFDIELVYGGQPLYYYIFSVE